MTEINLFTLAPGRAIEIPSQTMQHERPLQQLFERNLENLLGARFLASEFQAGEGRIDTLGLDDANRPVVVEYKRRTDENVITQGLSYVAWLKRNRDSIRWLVFEKLGKSIASKIDCSAPRLTCVASQFSNKDREAVDAWNQDIQLVRYRKFGEDLLMLEHLNSTKKTKSRTTASAKTSRTGRGTTVPYPPAGPKGAEGIAFLYEKLAKHLRGLGTDVQEHKRKRVVAFRRHRNFACVQLRSQKQALLVSVNLNPDNIEMVNGFTRDMRGISQAGTGDIEITIRTEGDLERAKPLLRKSYEAS